MFALVLLAAIGLLAVAVKKGRDRLASAPGWQPSPAPVNVQPVERSVMRETVSYLARLEPLATAEISPRISARIEDMKVDDGDRVKAGQLLAALDDRDIRAQVLAIESKIAAQEARLKANQASLEAARQDVAFRRREFERDQRLFREKGISASQVESSRNQLDAALGRLQSLEQESVGIVNEGKALEAQLEEARARLTFTEIRSPSAGIIRRQYLEVGDMARPGEAIFSLMDISCHRLAFDLVQEDLVRIQQGQKVLVYWQQDTHTARFDPVASSPSEDLQASYQATISRIFPSLEAGKTVRAEVDLFCVLPGHLKIGSFVPIDVVTEEGEGLTVPRGALLPTEQGGSAVYVVRSGSLQLVPVRILLADETRALVEGDLHVGEQVAVGEYLQWVRRSQGQRVEVQP
ncbi:efflux RND transporter periplasmic adaptor subunit [Desulfoferrobacter suflitae]|uniref:efflux RND transporter periplasmic adaptor subunit n=1 Tax=Desulfoferrobacter suflitae TaxID=2865782 RepID=UPI002164ECCE|nr:efflux RND transporter periplasmic adaptor subunit [Desulfoferrobacter suflitae]MCK8603758.1 efflux RND transporter periplasmic adaptor subunit [Desulfoferrobacter suflitae]